MFAQFGVMESAFFLFEWFQGIHVFCWSCTSSPPRPPACVADADSQAVNRDNRRCRQDSQPARCHPHNAGLTTRASQRGPRNAGLTTRASQRGPHNAGLATRPSPRALHSAAVATGPFTPPRSTQGTTSPWFHGFHGFKVFTVLRFLHVFAAPAASVCC